MIARPNVLWKEARLLLRGLRKDRAFAAFSIALLALGIGLVSSVFTLMWQAIYAQLPVPDPGQINTLRTNVTHAGRSEGDAMGAQTFSLPAYRYLAGHLSIPAGVIARHGELVNLETPGGPQHQLADFVAGNFFDVLGVQAPVGRMIQESNDTSSDGRFVAVLSYDLWQEAYGGQVSAWNSELRINGVQFRVIGVAPAQFTGLVGGQAPKVYLPVAAYADVNPGWQGYNDWSLRWLNLFVRLPLGVSAGMAEAELQPVYRAAVRQELASGGSQSPEYLNELAHEQIAMIPASQGLRGTLDQWRKPLRLLQWMTLAVLCLAAINVAGLMLVRGVKQKQQVLIRYALGATRSAVMRLYLIETLLLAIVGGAAGVYLARWGARFLAHLARMDQNTAALHLQSTESVAFHWMVVLAVGFLVALFPAWQAARIDLSSGMNEGALTHSATRSQLMTRRTLAAAQIALSLVLAVSAGLFAQALHRLVSVPVGFNPEHLTVFSVDAKLAHSAVEGTESLWAAIADRLNERPGVQAVTYGTGGPFPQGADMAVVLPGTSAAARAKHQGGIRSIVGPHYFATLGIRLLAGREFDSRDRQNTRDVVILNQTMAHKLFGNVNPIGQTVTMFNGLDPNWLATVVGVVADHHQSWRRANASLVYTPAQQARRVSDMTYYVRTAAPALPEAVIRETVRQEAPGLAAYDVATMESRMAEFASRDRALAMLVGAFAALALAIATIGIYGVVAYSATMRTSEFGVRVSVGATPQDIEWLVLREAFVILAGGIALGIPLTFVGLTIVRHQMEDIRFGDPLLYVGALVVLSICSLFAGLVPARRAAQANISETLRHS